jgi:hypothetical protein
VIGIGSIVTQVIDDQLGLVLKDGANLGSQLANGTRLSNIASDDDIATRVDEINNTSNIDQTTELCRAKSKGRRSETICWKEDREGLEAKAKIRY